MSLAFVVRRLKENIGILVVLGSLKGLETAQDKRLQKQKTDFLQDLDLAILNPHQYHFFGNKIICFTVLCFSGHVGGA